MSNKKGFTLVEVIIAIAALGVICAVLLKLFVLAGDTNKQAGSMQEAQLAVTSVAEVFISEESMQDAFDYLEIDMKEGISGAYTLQKGDIAVDIDITQKDGEYPGMLYSLDIRAHTGDKELAAISTARYAKEDAS
jgi:prepilin-type N-terminal cleavage/methylation domain-containing protein